MDERELHARVSALFQRVVDLDQEQREQILAEEQARPGGPLVVQRVRSLLDVNAESDTERPLDAASLLGQEIKDYEVLEILDEGGMGVVYRARRMEPTEEVAIKVLSAGPVTAELLERFHTEVQLLASCDHPGIVRYRDSGELRGGRPYLIMDLVDGPPLSLREPAVRDGVKETVDLVIHAAAAVQHLHARLALHRDLKPSNLLIARGPDGPRPVLIDLGIARPLDEEGIDLTQGRVLGTPSFMSPEQADGVTAHAPTDVYGLGAVLYFLLTGVPPRDLHEVAASDIEERRRRLKAPAVPPSLAVQAGVFDRARRIDGDLDAVVMKAIESDPRDRYDSVEALRADLYRWSTSRPVLAHPIGWRGRTWRLMKRYPKRITAGALVVLTLAIFAGVTRRSLVEAREARAGLEEQLGTTAVMRDFLIRDIFQAASLEELGPDTPVGEIVYAAADSIGAGIDDRPALAVGLRSALVPVFVNMGELERAREQVEKTRAIAERLDPSHPQRMEFDVERIYLAQYEGRAGKVVDEAREIIARIRSAELAPPSLLPRAVGVLGMTFYECNRLEEALACAEEAVRLLPAQDPGHWSARVSRNLFFEEVHGSEKALLVNEEFLNDLREHFGPEHHFVMGQATNLSITYLTLGRAEEGVIRAREAMDIADRRLDERDPTRLVVLNNLASNLSAAGDFDRAISLRREVYELRREALGPRSSAVPRAATNLASTLSRDGRYEQALNPAMAAIELITEQGRLDHPDAGYAHQALGVALAGTGDVSEALDALSKAIEILRAAEGNHTARIASIEKKMRALTAGD